MATTAPDKSPFESPAELLGAADGGKDETAPDAMTSKALDMSSPKDELNAADEELSLWMVSLQAACKLQNWILLDRMLRNEPAGCCERACACHPPGGGVPACPVLLALPARPHLSSSPSFLPPLLLQSPMVTRAPFILSKPAWSSGPPSRMRWSMHGRCHLLGGTVVLMRPALPLACPACSPGILRAPGILWHLNQHHHVGPGSAGKAPAQLRMAPAPIPCFNGGKARMRMNPPALPRLHLSCPACPPALQLPHRRAQHLQQLCRRPSECLVRWGACLPPPCSRCARAAT